MKIWHISDTHGYHELLYVPADIDTVIFTGDAANVRDPYRNEHELRTFLIWYNQLYIPNKIMIAGNHDSAFEKRLVTGAQCLKDYGVHYLEDELLEIDGIRFYGSPWTPQFGDWSFMKARGKINRMWSIVPDNVHILMTHGPGKGTLDISENRDREIEFCGDSSLIKAITKTIKPDWHCFGHIHNYGDHRNAGTLQLAGSETTFSNGSVVTDRRFGELSSNGTIFEIGA